MVTGVPLNSPCLALCCSLDTVPFFCMVYESNMTPCLPFASSSRVTRVYTPFLSGTLVTVWRLSAWLVDITPPPLVYFSDISASPEALSMVSDEVGRPYLLTTERTSLSPRSSVKTLFPFLSGADPSRIRVFPSSNLSRVLVPSSWNRSMLSRVSPSFL